MTTGSATVSGSTGATLSGSWTGATGNISESGFVWSANAGYLDSPEDNWISLGISYDDSNVGSNASGSISCTLETLDASTTYYYRAFVREYNASTLRYEYRFGSRSSFTTEAQAVAGSGYLTGYGMPDLTALSPTLRLSGTNSDRDDNWYSFSTSNSRRQIAVHTYTHPTSGEETLNYVVLYDGDNYAPLWTAHTMNTTYWPDNNAGRNDSWATDPAISLTQQTGLDNASSVGYSRGHLVASEYRQSSAKQNKQTFYYSNQAPQWQNGFNSSAAGYSGDGVWQQLESRVASQAPAGTTMLYVVTGVLYEGTVTTLKSGSGALNVPIPSHFYKCIMKCTLNASGSVTAAQGIAFVYSNVSHPGESYCNAEFVTSIDAIEQRAGFDFFASVPDNLESAAESNTNHSWFTGE